MRCRFAFAAVVLALPFPMISVAAAQNTGAQRGSDSARKVLVIPGQRDGASVFPLSNYKEVRPLVEGQMDFRHYHTSAEIEWWMEKWAREHPDFVELYSVGKTFGGRDIRQMTFTNRKTGKHTDKPAAFFEGGRHSGEITATESALYLAWYLVENYGKDAAVTKLIDEKTVYIRPLNNPDGSDMYRLTAQTNRSTVRPHDTDRDGLLDEDPGEDLDNDGYVRDMRKLVGAGKGNFVRDTMDAKGRLMRRVPNNTGDWMVYSEGIDNDLDGNYNEDGIGGLDLHRNYPENWRPEPGRDSTGRGNTQFGAGEYPLSEPETRAVVMWVLTHPNIGVANSMDTSVPMHLRGPSSCEETECMFPSDLKWFQHFDSVGLSHTKYPWAGDVYRTYATRQRVNPVTGDTARPQALFGHGPDFGYFYVGAIWYGDELWNGGRERDYNGDGRVEQWEVMRYCDENFAGSCFKAWEKYQHPALGEVEIGGFNPKFWSQNGPPEVMEPWARNQAMFNLYMAMSLPKVEITDVAVTKVRAGKDSATHEVRVTVRNSGRLPTALEQAKRVKIVRPDEVNASPLARGSATRMLGRAPEFWLNGGETRTVSIRVKTGDKPDDKRVRVRLLSTRGGMAEREVELVP